MTEQEQAALAGDVLAEADTSGQPFTVPVIPQEDDGTAKEKTDADNAKAKDWRKSDKEWQEMAEKAKKGESADQTLAKLRDALGIEQTKANQNVDVVDVLKQRIETLEFETARAKWEKSNPAVDTADYREEWTEIVKKKGHLVKSGDLTYDDLWAIIRKDSKPSTSVKDYREQELSVGSVPLASKTAANPSDIDPDVYAAMKQAGFTDEQIRSS